MKIKIENKLYENKPIDCETIILIGQDLNDIKKKIQFAMQSEKELTEIEWMDLLKEVCLLVPKEVAKAYGEPQETVCSKFLFELAREYANNDLLPSDVQMKNHFFEKY